MDKLFSPAAYADKKQLLFAYELHRARWQRCNDPRDHVFALLGHPAAVDSTSGKRWTEADYTKGLEEVYHELAVRLLTKGDDLMMLNVVQHESLERALKRPLPTWVPQWDDQSSICNLLGDDVCVYNPLPNLRPSLRFTDANRTLWSPGVVIDSINSTSHIFEASDFSINSSTIGELWKAQPECIDAAFTTTTTYRGHQERQAEPALFAFLETLSAVKKRRTDPHFPLQQRYADGAAWLIATYKTPSATNIGSVIGENVMSLAQSGDSQRWLERVSGGARGRRFARGQSGWYALVSPAAEMGDRMVLLRGGKTGFCLRPIPKVEEIEEEVEQGSEGKAEDDEESRQQYWFVGECYVHGVMDGQAVEMLERGELREAVLSIQ
jgi:hypothetical protein